MTLEDLLTLPLHKRIEWLRKKTGSHDKLAARLGTTRQTVIGWEKGAQPNKHYRGKLAGVSGYPTEAFRRSAAEREVWALTETHLKALEARLDRLYAETARGFELLGHQQHGLDAREEGRG